MAGSRSACPSGRRAAAPRCRPLSWCSFFGLCAVSWHALPCDAAWPRSESWQAGGVPGPSATGALVGLGVGRDGAGVARGRAGVAWGEVGLAGLCTTAIGAWVATAAGCVTTGAGGTGGRLCRGNGRWRDGWSGRLVLTRILGLPGPDGCRVHGRSGRRRCRAGGARRGRGRRRERRPCGRDGADIRGRSRCGKAVSQRDRGQDEVDDAKGEHEPEALRTAHVDPRLPQRYRWPASSSPLATMVAPVRRRPTARAGSAQHRDLDRLIAGRSTAGDALVQPDLIGTERHVEGRPRPPRDGRRSPRRPTTPSARASVRCARSGLSSMAQPAARNAASTDAARAMSSG